MLNFALASLPVQKPCRDLRQKRSARRNISKGPGLHFAFENSVRIGGRALSVRSLSRLSVEHAHAGRLICAADARGEVFAHAVAAESRGNKKSSKPGRDQGSEGHRLSADCLISRTLRRSTTARTRGKVARFLACLEEIGQSRNPVHSSVLGGDRNCKEVAGASDPAESGSKKPAR